MKNKALYLMMAIGSTAILGWGSAVYSTETAVPENTDRARLCKIYNTENVAPRIGGVCLSPAHENKAGLCVTDSEAHNTFSYIIKDNKSLDFGLSYWFSGGAHCGIIGNAVPTKTGWRYENNMKAADSRQRCAFNITVGNDALVINSDLEASCRMECGAQAHLINVSIPLSTLESRDVTQKSFEPEIFFNTPCKE